MSFYKGDLVESGAAGSAGRRQERAFANRWSRAENERVQWEQTMGVRASKAIGNMTANATYREDLAWIAPNPPRPIMVKSAVLIAIIASMSQGKASLSKSRRLRQR